MKDKVVPIKKRSVPTGYLFDKEDVEVGTRLEFVGRKRPARTWKVVEIVTPMPDGEEGHFVQARQVRTFKDLVYMESRGEQICRQFNGLCWSAAWRIK